MQVRWCALLLAVAVATLQWSDRCTAQDDDHRRPKPEVKWDKEVRGEGAYHGAQGPALRLTVGTTEFLGQVHPGSLISVEGTADRDALRSGMVVEIRGEFDRKTSKTIEPISEITIIGMRQMPGLGFEAEESAFAAGQKRGPPSPTVRGTLRAMVTGLKNNLLQMGRYKAELASELKISVKSPDLALASVGDHIKVKGNSPRLKVGDMWIDQQGTPVVRVDELTVTMVSPLSAPKRGSPGRPAKGKSAERGGFEVANEFEKTAKDGDGEDAGKDATKEATKKQEKKEVKK